MKRFQRAVIALLVLALALGMSACSKEEKGKALIGQWELTGGSCETLGLDFENFHSAGMTVNLAFEEENVLSITTAKQSLPQTSQAGEWSVEKETVSLSLGDTKTQWSWKVEEDSLALTSEDGSSLQFLKK